MEVSALENYNLRLTWLNEDDPEENHDEFGIVSEDGERLDLECHLDF